MWSLNTRLFSGRPGLLIGTLSSMPVCGLCQLYFRNCAACQTYGSAGRLDRQKAALHGNILGKVRHAALPLQLPFLQHICAVGHELGEVDVLLGEYD